MTHRFPIKEIARQSGLGVATVDRVLNNRAHVSPQTRQRVLSAIDELAGQEAQLAARGRRLFFDFVIEAPNRFTREVRAAGEAVLPQIGAAVCRPRFLMQEIMSDEEVVASLARILKRGSHGVCLKVRDTPKIRQAVNRLCEAGIPMVTLVTDLKDTERLAYIGLDNAGAGRTAAYLVAKMMRDAEGSVLATRSHERFLGEEERERAFVEMLGDRCPNLQVISLQGGRGGTLETSKMLENALDAMTDLRAVYSIGGGNRSILATLDENKLIPELYIAHDLDADNRRLIRDRRIDFILHHDLSLDMRHIFQVFLAHHKLMIPTEESLISNVQVLTPENVPDEVGVL